MLDEIKKIIDDERPIKGISLNNKHGGNFHVGQLGVTKIVPYGENGMGAHITWIAVYAGEEITARIAPNTASIYY